MSKTNNLESDPIQAEHGQESVHATTHPEPEPIRTVERVHSSTHDQTAALLPAADRRVDLASGEDAVDTVALAHFSPDPTEDAAAAVDPVSTDRREFDGAATIERVEPEPERPTVSTLPPAAGVVPVAAAKTATVSQRTPRPARQPLEVFGVDIAPVESRGYRFGYLTLAILLTVLYLLLTLQWWAPAHPGVDQNGYFVGGRHLAQTGTMRYVPESPFGFIGAMYVTVERGQTPELLIPENTPEAEAAAMRVAHFAERWNENLRHFPKYPIGLPLLFACCFWLFGPETGVWASNLVSPVSASLSLLGMFLMVRLLAGSFMGILSMFVLGFSQVTLTLSTNPNSHAPALFFATWGMYLLLRYWKFGSAWNALAAGFFLGFAVTIRYTEALLLLPMAIVALTRVPWSNGHDPKLWVTLRSANALLGVLACVGVGLVWPVWQIVATYPRFDWRLPLMLALVTPLPWLLRMLVVSLRETDRMHGVLGILIGLGTAAVLLAVYFDMPWTLLLLPAVWSIPLRFASWDAHELEWSRFAAVVGFATVACTLALLYNIPGDLPGWTLIVAGAFYALLGLRWEDVYDPARPWIALRSRWRAAAVVAATLPLLSVWIIKALAIEPIYFWLRLIDPTLADSYFAAGVLIPTLMLPVLTAVVVYLLRREDAGHLHAYLDAPRVILSALLLLAAVLPAIGAVPQSINDTFARRQWLFYPFAIFVVATIAMLFASRTWQIRRSITPHLLSVGWLIPVGYLVGFNLIEMGTLTGYDPTNESEAYAFTWANFWGNWEKVVRQVHDIGLFFTVPLGLVGLVMLYRRSWQVATVLLSWLIPGLVIYAMYYWSPERGTAYLRFFLTLFPPLIAGMGFALWYGLIRGESNGLSRVRSVAMPLAAGVVVAVSVGVATWRTAVGSTEGVRGGQTLATLHRTNRNLANLAQIARAHIPDRAMLLTEAGGFSGASLYLQFVGDWDVYAIDAFDPRSQRRLQGRTLGEDDPNPVQPFRQELVREWYGLLDRHAAVAGYVRTAEDALGIFRDALPAELRDEPRALELMSRVRAALRSPGRVNIPEHALMELESALEDARFAPLVAGLEPVRQWLSDVRRPRAAEDIMTDELRKRVDAALDAGRGVFLVAAPGSERNLIRRLGGNDYTARTVARVRDYPLLRRVGEQPTDTPQPPRRGGSGPGGGDRSFAIVEITHAQNAAAADTQ